MKLNPILLADFYKLSHRKLYPEKTEIVYSTFTPRVSRIPQIQEVVCFGIQAFLIDLEQMFQNEFFSRPVADVVAKYKRFVSKTLGDPDPETKHLEELHAVGYLPLMVKALKEGTRVPMRVPMLTVQNTDPRFFWLTNYIETLLSCELWQPMTTATIAAEYRRILDLYAMKTTGSTAGVEFLGHDFSMRGMAGVRAAAASGAGHLLSFVGTDVCPAIDFCEEYYGANIETELVGTSIPASEHSVACSHGMDEITAFKHIITKVHPTGFVSLVSDTWDLWAVLTVVVPSLKAEILERAGRLVIRPDSGDPELIICGNPDGKSEAERKGVIQLLWETFGGTISPTGHKILDSHIGCIYGDAITLERCAAICDRLEKMDFASTNMVYGIGSYSYQYVTRDTFGFAMKSTCVVVDGIEKQIFKDPITDNGMKKSQKGRVRVHYGELSEKLFYIDELGLKDNDSEDRLELVFDGKLRRFQNLANIRAELVSTRK